jgi:hypothetical protein
MPVPKRQQTPRKMSKPMQLGPGVPFRLKKKAASFTTFTMSAMPSWIGQSVSSACSIAQGFWIGISKEGEHRRDVLTIVIENGFHRLTGTQGSDGRSSPSWQAPLLPRTMKIAIAATITVVAVARRTALNWIHFRDCVSAATASMLKLA